MTPPDRSTSTASSFTALDILEKLVAIPVLPGQKNRQIVDFIAQFLEGQGVQVSRLVGPEGDRENLFATIGPNASGGVILSGHMDVVPVEGQPWTSDPFALAKRDGKLFGRGATDMKGFLACVLAAVPYFKSLNLSVPIHIAFSYDEEIGCRGVPHLIDALPSLCEAPAFCVVGEPTGMKPVLAHKGKVAAEFTFKGKSAHSSTPGLGENAIYPAAELLLYARELANELEAEGPFDPRFDPPHSTVVSGVVHGGSAVNIIPEICSARLEVRSIPAQQASDIMQKLDDKRQSLQEQARQAGGRLETSVTELASYPGLAPTENRQFIAMMERLAGTTAEQSVAYGTEAGLFAKAGIDTIVCGPGLMERAHKADEFILEEELNACSSFLRKLADEFAG